MGPLGYFRTMQACEPSLPLSQYLHTEHTQHCPYPLEEETVPASLNTCIYDGEVVVSQRKPEMLLEVEEDMDVG